MSDPVFEELLRRAANSIHPVVLTPIQADGLLRNYFYGKCFDDGGVALKGQQSRMQARHTANLARIMKTDQYQPDSNPLVFASVSGRIVALVDGHHRLAALQTCKVPREVYVRVLERSSLEEVQVLYNTYNVASKVRDITHQISSYGIQHPPPVLPKARRRTQDLACQLICRWEGLNPLNIHGDLKLCIETHRPAMDALSRLHRSIATPSMQHTMSVTLAKSQKALAILILIAEKDEGLEWITRLLTNSVRGQTDSATVCREELDLIAGKHEKGTRQLMKSNYHHRYLAAAWNCRAHRRVSRTWLQRKVKSPVSFSALNTVFLV